MMLMRIKKLLGLVTVKDLHKHWINPDEQNSPRNYEHKIDRSIFLINFIKDHISKDERILELGCNCGRNIAHLYLQGYRELSGIDISKKAILFGKHMMPYLGKILSCMEIERLNEIQPLFKQGLIFSMAVLEHIHPNSAQKVFEEMTTHAKYICTIEDEKSRSAYHYPRNYKQIFEKLGFLQIKEQKPDPELFGSGGFVARFFIRAAKATNNIIPEERLIIVPVGALV